MCPRCGERPKVGGYCRECKREYDREWRNRNLDISRARCREAYRRNAAARKAYVAEWGRRNPEKRKQYRDAWAEKNPASVIASRRRSNELRRNVRPTRLDSEYEAILRRDPCAYCGDRTQEIDHIVPVRHGGTAEWTNLTGACAGCNRSKGAKSLLLFMAAHKRG